MTWTLVAYGKGLGSSPVALTMPAGLPVLEELVVPTRPSAAVPWSPAKAPSRVTPEEVFIREELSADDLRWARCSRHA
jgi:hypothetical protein